MSVNMDMDGVEYADHEVQHVSLQSNVTGAGDVGDDRIFNTEPVSERGIDSDELAELVAMYRQINILILNENEGNQEQIGAVTGEAQFGINVSPTEILSRQGNQGTEVDGQIVNNQDDGTLSVLQFDDPGILDYEQMEAKPGASDPNSDDIGPGDVSGAHAHRFVNLKEQFGSGPYLDKTDDLSFHQEVTGDNITDGTDVFLNATYTLYWSVEQLPEGRSSFARP